MISKKCVGFCVIGKNEIEVGNAEMFEVFPIAQAPATKIKA